MRIGKPWINSLIQPLNEEDHGCTSQSNAEVRLLLIKRMVLSQKIGDTAYVKFSRALQAPFMLIIY